MGSTRIGAELIGMICVFNVSIACNSTQCKCNVAYSEQRYFQKLYFFLIPSILYFNCRLTLLQLEIFKKFLSLKSGTFRS